MIAGVAHEVGTPLSVIKTRLQMWETALERYGEEGKVIDPEAMNMVINEINRVSDLMKRLVVFSRPIYDNLEPTSVNKLIEEVLSMMDLEQTGKKVRVIKKLEESPCKVNSDPNSLKQVLINVITNAMESLEVGGEILIETGFEPPAGSMTIRIADSGSGIDEKIMDHIFDPFYTTKETGTGLGLAISHEIILSHGGSIDFLKNEPRGTICFITLPLITETS
jgi:signal transduction histidine kinase